MSALHCIHQPVLLCKPRRILPNRSQASAFTYDNWLLLFNCDQHSSCCECCLRFFGPAAANCARSSGRISQSRILAHLLLFVVTTLWLLCVAALWSQDADVLFWSLALFTQFAIKTPKSRRYLSNPWMPSEKFFGYFIRFWYSSSYYLQTLSNLFIPNHLAAISYNSQRALFWFKTLLNACLAPACLESEYFALRKFARLDNRRHKSLKVLVTLCWLC